jgi:mediator of RNA polymerase II transcription subunit 13
MADLDTIMDPHETTENKNSNPTTISDHNIKSPNRKDNTSLLPPPPVPTISIYNNIYPLNKSFNGGLFDFNIYHFSKPLLILVYHHEIEQIYNTPPGSSSSEKLQVLHSPYAIIAETASHVANTFDTLNQFSQETILAPFEPITVTEQSSYYPIQKISVKKADQRYEPSKSSSKMISARQKTFRNWKHTLPINDLSSSPFNNQQLLRQQPTPRSLPTPTHFSPMRSNDLQSSPYLTRSVGSVQTINSPIGNLPSLIPEIDSLILNVLLNDSILNIYRDINFDSCVLCACTSNELSIHGIDSIIYLEKSRDHMKSIHSQGYSHEQSSYQQHSTIYPQSQSINNSCSCGFSSVVNLRLSHASGLFYEDEIEITGIKTDVKYRQSNDHLSVHLLELIEKKECLSSPFDYFNHSNTPKKSTQDILQTTKQPFYQCKSPMILNSKDKFHIYLDENFACRLAIDQARNHSTGSLADDIDKHHWLHQWSYSTSPLDSDQQLITMLRSLQPLLVDALKKRSVNGLWSTIDGPLTWKSFHQLLYVQKQHAHLEEQISGPQPIPYVLAGFEREWIMLAPYGLRFWDKLCLEPYAKRKNIGYICVVPDNDYVCSMTKTYMRELSTHYELCRLGSHRPLLKAFPDQGLLRISSRNNDSTQLPNIDQWFTDHETTHPLGSRLKLYAQILKEKLCKSLISSIESTKIYFFYVVNILSTQSFDDPIFDDNTSRRDAFRAPNDLSSADSHTTTSNNDLTNHNYSLSPTSSSSSNTLIANNIYTTGSAVADTLSISSTNGASVNGQQVDSTDLQAFESFYHGRSLNDDQLFIVIYLIDTFRYELTGLITNENENIDIDVYVKKAMFRAYMDLMKDLPEKISVRINIQVNIERKTFFF